MPLYRVNKEIDAVSHRKYDHYGHLNMQPRSSDHETPWNLFYRLTAGIIFLAVYNVANSKELNFKDI